MGAIPVADAPSPKVHPWRRRAVAVRGTGAAEADRARGLREDVRPGATGARARRGARGHARRRAFPARSTARRCTRVVVGYEPASIIVSRRGDAQQDAVAPYVVAVENAGADPVDAVQPTLMRAAARRRGPPGIVGVMTPRRSSSWSCWWWWSSWWSCPSAACKEQRNAHGRCSSSSYRHPPQRGEVQTRAVDENCEVRERSRHARRCRCDAVDANNVCA